MNDGDLYCEHCAMEIRIVPEFDAQVEQQIDEAMRSVSDEVGPEAERQAALLAKQEERERRRLRRGRRMKLLAAALLACAAALLLGMGLQRWQSSRSASYFVGEAYRYAKRGEFDEAAAQIERAMVLSEEPGVSLLLLRAEYLQKAGRTQEAAEAAQEAALDQTITSEERVDAYGRLLAVYASQGRYEEAAALLAACSDEAVRAAYGEYLIAEPTFDMPAGSYEDVLLLTISPGCEASVFYTIDGTRPSTKSALYREPLRLQEGEYEISAICVNHFGVESGVVTRRYEVAPARPDAPQVLTDSGTYSSPAYITVAKPSRGEVHYTTDGTEPTEDSPLYTERIAMPVGASTFRFVCIGENGVASEVVERHYQMNVSSSFSVEDGPNYILVALIQAGEVVDTVGTIRDGSARYSYTYQGLRQVQGYGTFFIYTEALTDYMAGDTVLTGRRFAVNTKNGTVNLYNQDGTLQPF